MALACLLAPNSVLEADRACNGEQMRIMRLKWVALADIDTAGRLGDHRWLGEHGKMVEKDARTWTWGCGSVTIFPLGFLERPRPKFSSRTSATFHPMTPLQDLRINRRLRKVVPKSPLEPILPQANIVHVTLSSLRPRDYNIACLSLFMFRQHNINTSSSK